MRRQQLQQALPALRPHQRHKHFLAAAVLPIVARLDGVQAHQRSLHPPGHGAGTNEALRVIEELRCLGAVQANGLHAHQPNLEDVGIELAAAVI